MKPRKPRKSGRPPVYRIIFVGLLLSAGLVALGYRLVILQVVQAGELSHRAGHQHEKTIPIEGERGTIRDREGRLLATNVKVPSIYGIPALIKNPTAVSKRLSRILKGDGGPDAGEIRKKLKTTKKFVWINRKIKPSSARRIMDAELPGIGRMEESQRFYPKRKLMGHLLGFAGLDNRGLEGLEFQYDSFLRGETGWVILERDAHGRSVFPKDLDYARPSRGNNLILTLDEVIQHIAERELEAAIEASKALAGTVVVMDPRTGEVLALAVRPAFNPNQISRGAPGRWRNTAVTDTYEPGSTVKVVAASAALEKGLAQPEDLFYCEEGRMELAGGPMRDHKAEGYLTFREVIQKSSNICTVKIAMRVGEDNLYRAFRDFGFGEKTGVDLPGESPGMIRSPESWSGRSLASLAIGHELLVTPIQLATAFSALANGGWLMRPYLVSEIRGPEGELIQKILPQMRRQVVSADTASRMMSILEGTVAENGTGIQAAVPGYRVAGKTGTAQKIDPETGRYSKKETIVSFVGAVPAEDPRLVVLVIVDGPEKKPWASQTAAPLFRKIVEPVLQYLEIPPGEKTRGTVVASVEASVGASGTVPVFLKEKSSRQDP